MTRITPDTGCVVITGAGSGLGRALAQRLGAQGFAVAGLGRRAEALAETAALCPETFLPLPLDVTDAEAVRQGIAQITDRLGPVAILINNAAVYPHRDILDETAESFMHTVGVNLGGAVACTLAVLPQMVARGHGRILNVSSFADIAPLAAASAYSVSKGAGRILTRALVADLADRFPEIVITDWSPGILRTEMGLPDGLPPEEAARWGAALACMADPSLNGVTFERDTEMVPPRGLKARLRDTLLMRKPQPRRL